MRCEICETLQRERSREGEAEATAIMHQRTPDNSIADRGPHDHKYEEMALTSRKKQVQISFSLNRHIATDHRPIVAVAGGAA